MSDERPTVTFVDGNPATYRISIGKFLVYIDYHNTEEFSWTTRDEPKIHRDLMKQEEQPTERDD